VSDRDISAITINVTNDALTYDCVYWNAVESNQKIMKDMIILIILA